MLAPKRVKYRKQMRGRMRGKATRGATVEFGDYGLQALEPAWITARRLTSPGREKQILEVKEKMGLTPVWKV